jgi:hypothetical protein
VCAEDGDVSIEVISDLNKLFIFNIVDFNNNNKLFICIFFSLKHTYINEIQH